MSACPIGTCLHVACSRIFEIWATTRSAKQSRVQTVMRNRGAAARGGRGGGFCSSFVCSRCQLYIFFLSCRDDFFCRRPERAWPPSPPPLPPRACVRACSSTCLRVFSVASSQSFGRVEDAAYRGASWGLARVSQRAFVHSFHRSRKSIGRTPFMSLHVKPHGALVHRTAVLACQKRQHPSRLFYETRRA